MKIQDLTFSDYGDLRNDLFRKHAAQGSDPTMDSEWKSICDEFTARFGALAHEIPDWHYDRRSFCAYLYTSEFYNREFTATVSQILNSKRHPWFAEFECYSAVTPDGEAVGERFLGWMMVYRDSVLLRRDADGSSRFTQYFGCKEK